MSLPPGGRPVDPPLNAEKQEDLMAEESGEFPRQELVDHPGETARGGTGPDELQTRDRG